MSDQQSDLRGLSGTDIMRRINDGDLVKAPIEAVERVKREITENCEELIESGARIRPLLVNGVQTGWVRGLHLQERKMLKRWVKEPNDFVLNSLLLATSLTREELEELPALEIRALAEVVKQMGEHDVSLYPYLPAFVSTQSSENLWFGKGDSLTTYENRIITLPDGKAMKIMAPPDHARMWASLCTYREQAKRRLGENFNSLFIVRPWAGKNADPIAAELKGVARQLETDSLSPWEKVVRISQVVGDVNDGWAHAGDSVDDLKREMDSMLAGDKHERLMETWQKQMQAEAEDTKRKLEELRRKRGTNEPGIVEERHEVLTDAQIKARQAALRQGKPLKTREEYEVTQSNKDRLKRYR